MGPDDWREAFAHHPRIGERAGDMKQDSRAAGWSAGEQSGVSGAPDIHERLAGMNERYEQRFGHIYIVCAAGRTGDEMLALAEDRLGNDAVTELRMAAEEQRKIMELRLRKLIGDHK